ncbi:cupin domain-containing protein [Shewanella salipaludis]|uniref:Cupin domain-containing protein n=1 Tax=Shewanella salipaludis TaxID=2723052 RepID=A0A972JLV7_9GAMM|nr:cupin domain-containing protein [Shewanella salipaludis]NMH65857.1 cupin domain-containing protein [Shewanella salipaludis]
MMKPRDHLLTAAEIAAMEAETKTHFLNPKATRTKKSLGDAIGLQHIGVHQISIAPGCDSTEYHKHYFEEECVYVLGGVGEAHIGGETFALGAGDFMAFPADGAGHSMHNNGTQPLVFLVMGQRLVQDVADYPRKNKRLYRHRGSWDLVDIEAIDKLK